MRIRATSFGGHRGPRPPRGRCGRWVCGLAGLSLDLELKHERDSLDRLLAAARPGTAELRVDRLVGP